MRLRFAPSPTGQLHVGNARTALFNWLLARRTGGTLILRIEDTDTERSTRESELAILEDLRWLGLEWDEGPDRAGPHGPYRQSERLQIYRDHAGRLLDAGRAYFCFCTAGQLEAERQLAMDAGEQPRYSGRCRGLDPARSRARMEAGEPAAIRFAVRHGPDVVFEDIVRGEVRFSRDVIGDPVIVRSDGHPAYNFAVVVDDALMEVTHVVRGEDHVSNTPRQWLLYEALGYRPPRFAHLSLVLGPDHTPLSKRHGATSVAEFRSRGILPEALVNYLALLGWSPGENQEILPLPELAARFAIEDVGRSASVFDPGKLAWMNRHYMRSADPGRLAALLVPFLVRAGVAGEVGSAGREYLSRFAVPMIAGAVDRLDECAGRIGFLFAFDPTRALADDAVSGELAEVPAAGVVAAFDAELAGMPRLLDRTRFRELAARVRERTGQKGRALFHPIRLVLTGRPDGPELDLAVPAIDNGAELPATAGLAPIAGCRERARAFARALDARASSR
jgi:glutamyl-tRNA synthetase/nondiscriminating glutamyl-tRNA synthetase